MAISDIETFASSVWESLGSPSTTSPVYIGNWVTHPQTLGTLNNLVGTCYSGIPYVGEEPFNFDVDPPLSPTDFSILDQLYQIRYYKQCIARAAGANGTMKVVQSIGEGDTKVTYVGAASMIAAYNASIKEANEQLKYLVNTYLENSAGSKAPRTVDFYNVAPNGFSIDSPFGVNTLGN